MMTNKIKQAFDRAANSYDAHGCVQHQVGIKLTHLIQSLQPQADCLLDLGCGTGLTTQFLATQYRYQEFHAIDISPALLASARTRLNPLGIQTTEMDFDALSGFHHAFDIIYANLSLQWSKDLSSLITNLHSLLHEQSILAFSLPLAGTFHELESHCAMNPAHDNKTISNLIIENGYELLAQETENRTLIFPHTLQALKSIKQIGANHVRHRKHKGLYTKSWLEKITLNELTYVIGYFIARKRSS